VTSAVALPRSVALVEYEPTSVSRAVLGEADARRLWEAHRSRVTVESPAFAGSTDWVLTSQGWVGWIPVSPVLTLELAPRVRLAGLFGMLEYAYRLKSFHILPGIVDSHTLQEVYENLVAVLAGRVMDRVRRGLYRSYVSDRDALPYLRGRLDIEEALARPERVRLPCIYEENTADLEENQILAWVLQARPPAGTSLAPRDPRADPAGCASRARPWGSTTRRGRRPRRTPRSCPRARCRGAAAPRGCRCAWGSALRSARSRSRAGCRICRGSTRTCG
jgi:hypothetical protein